MHQVFLGGTCGSNPWREQLVIPGLLARGIPAQALFNPVVAQWDAQAQAREDEAKRTATYQLYVIANPDPQAQTANLSAYSLVELVMALYDAPERTVVVFATTGMADHTAKAIRKAAQDLYERFPSAPIFTDYTDAVEWLAAHLQPHV